MLIIIVEGVLLISILMGAKWTAKNVRNRIQFSVLLEVPGPFLRIFPWGGIF